VVGRAPQERLNRGPAKVRVAADRLPEALDEHRAHVGPRGRENVVEVEEQPRDPTDLDVGQDRGPRPTPDLRRLLALVASLRRKRRRIRIAQLRVIEQDGEQLGPGRPAEAARGRGGHVSGQEVVRALDRRAKGAAGEVHVPDRHQIDVDDALEPRYGLQRRTLD
jgi:hypothetical protein